MRIAVIVLGFQADFRHLDRAFSRRCSLLKLVLISSGLQEFARLFYADSANRKGSGSDLDFLPTQLLRLRIVLKQIRPW